MAKVALRVSTDGGWHTFIARFADADQAIAYIGRKSAVASFDEIEDELLTPVCGPVAEDVLRLLDVLYPQCEHGLSLALCGGPMHWHDPS